jgi:uncharacterized membrane protein YphA (DoxX/SURF4 family)
MGGQEAGKAPVVPGERSNSLARPQEEGSIMDTFDLILWVVQVVLGAIFIMAGFIHAFRYEKARERLPWVGALPRKVVILDGIVEILGGVGVILPRLTNFLPWLTPVAAAGLAAVMAIAMALHAMRKEYSAIAMTGFLLLLAVFVAVGRWFLAP